ncbi:MAG TPA: V-type ATP synthase subunit D [Candidatus Bathyarchaeia archaeon]|nr:V-type ATP synthase subunit D [Candidatus Bathyarchaeia archaeon]
MALREVKPTRSELLEIKKKIRLSESGYNLLKMKRDGLLLEFFDVLEKAKDASMDLANAYKIAKEKIDIAEMVEGVIEVYSAAFALKHKPEVALTSRSLMGVTVPEVSFTAISHSIDERGYGIIGTSSAIDEAAAAYEELLDKIIRAAEVETAVKRLLMEIERIKRRVNALEFRVIPDLKEAEAFIMFRLEEMERENIFRLKKIKKKAVSSEAA